MFSRRSARFLLETAGYRDVKIGAICNSYPLNYWLKLFPSPKMAKKLAMTIAERTGLGRLPVALSAGNLVAVAFKRK